MAEPTSSAIVAVTAGGWLAVFWLVTGLHPGLLVAGLAGSFAGLSYLPEQIGIGQRVTSVLVGALGAAWGTPLAVAMVGGSVPAEATPHVLQFPLALGLGFLSFTAIAPAVIRIAQHRLRQQEGER